MTMTMTMTMTLPHLPPLAPQAGDGDPDAAALAPVAWLDVAAGGAAGVTANCSIDVV